MKLKISPSPPAMVRFFCEGHSKNDCRPGVHIPQEKYTSAMNAIEGHRQTCYDPNLDEYARFIGRDGTFNHGFSYTFYLDGGIIQLDRAITLIHETREDLSRLVETLGLPQTEPLPSKPHMTSDEREEDFFRMQKERLPKVF